mgnify:CR=1 FL=1
MMKRMSVRHLVCSLAVFIAALGGACIDWGDPEMATTSSASSMDDDDCDDRCGTKAQGCGATEDFADMVCSTFCGTADETSLSCLEEATCQEVALVFQQGADPCGEEADDGNNMCINVGGTGCDPLSGVTCCDQAVCESSTGRCCLPANQPSLACTSNLQCCGNATCQLDPNDASKRWCR